MTCLNDTARRAFVGRRFIGAPALFSGRLQLQELDRIQTVPNHLCSQRMRQLHKRASSYTYILCCCINKGTVS